MAASDGREELLPLGDVERPWGRIAVQCDAERLTAFLTCQTPNRELTPGEVHDILREGGVKVAPDPEAVAQAIELAAAGDDWERVPVARGKTPRPGADSHLDLCKEPLTRTQDEAGRDAEAPAEQADYRAVYRFDNIRAGDLVATYVPRTRGTAGLDVCGEPLPPEPGEEKSFPPGSNVTFDPGAGAYRATADGLLRVQEGSVSVEPVFSVPHAVDMTVGNIDFIGRIEVGGDVLDGFELHGETGIEVQGVVEACRLTSRRSIIIQGGVKGREKGHIQCDGHFTARFLDSVHVTCGGDVVIRKEIIDSIIHSHGRVIVERGAIVNSHIVALKGIIAHDVGSDLGVRTTLIAGLDYRVANEILAHAGEIRALQEQVQTRTNHLGYLLTRLRRSAAPAPRDLSEARDAMADLQQRRSQLMALERQAGSLSRISQQEGHSHITITGTLHPGSVLILGEQQRTQTAALSGPLRLAEDEFAGTVEVSAAPAVALPEPPTLETPLPETALHSTARVLVVDDEVDVRSIITETLRHEDIDCTAAADAPEALAALQRGSPFDLLILDIRMPGEHGLMLLRRVREMPECAAVPVVVMSAYFDAEALLKVEEQFSRTTSMPKPFDPVRLAAHIRHCLSRSGPVAQGFALRFNETRSTAELSPVPIVDATITARKQFYRTLRRYYDAIRVDTKATEAAFAALARNEACDRTFSIAVTRRPPEERTGKAAGSRKLFSFPEVQELYTELLPREIDGRGKHVLIAEDMTPMRRILQAELERRHFTVTAVKDGTQALAAIAEAPPDCCVLDVNMPGMSGLQLLGALREKEDWRHIPVILCTCVQDKAMLVGAIKMGIAGIVIKPVDFDDLAGKIDTALQSGSG